MRILNIFGMMKQSNKLECVHWLIISRLCDDARALKEDVYCNYCVIHIIRLWCVMRVLVLLFRH